MKNKEIQESRMKGYFIQATKDILKAEGLKSLSVRNIAAQAGYSYTTMYNYFKDVNDLVFLCVEDFQNECASFVSEKRKMDADGIERLRSVVKAYCNYFIEYPGVFELFYIERMSDFGGKQSIIDLTSNSFDIISADDWSYCIKNKLFDPEKAEYLKKQTKYTLIGLLILYLNRRTPGNYTEIMERINQQFDFLIKC